MELQLLALFIAALGVCTSSNSAKEPVYISLVVSSAPAFNTLEIIPAINQTLELVHRNITPSGYHLQYKQVLDVQCESKQALNLLRKVISNVSAIVGCGCSLVTQEIAKESDIPVISYASTSAALSDRSVYPNLFRTVPSDEPLAPALATVMQYYGWKTLSILTEQQTQFLKLLTLLGTSLSAASISIENSVQFNKGNLSEAAETISDGNSHIIMLNTNPKPAIFYLCRAFLEGRFYPGYVWITPGWYQQGWWKADEDYLRSLNCTTSDIEKQLNRSLVLLPHPNTSSVNVTEPFNSSSYAMDAVMTLALALTKTVEDSPHNLSLNTDAIQHITFSGASGIVQFDARGNRGNAIVLLQQFRMNTNGSIALHCIAKIVDSRVMYINGEGNSSTWPDARGFPPIVVIINVMKTPVYAFVVILNTIGIILSIGCLIFDIIFQNRKTVKLTSPNLNYAIVFGAVVLMLGGLLVPGFPLQNKEKQAIICEMHRITQTTGYDICFVVALVKTGRILYIFRVITPNKKEVKDWHLLLLSIGIVMIDVVCVGPLLILNYVYGDTWYEPDFENPPSINEHGYRVVQYGIQCDYSPTFVAFISVTMAYKMILHIIGLILAFHIRKVKIEPLNDSKYSAIIMYCSFIFLILAITVIFGVPGINGKGASWTVFVFIEVCIFLGLTFIPKMVLLYKDPHGTKIFSSSTPDSLRRVTSDIEYQLI